MAYPIYDTPAQRSFDSSAPDMIPAPDLSAQAAAAIRKLRSRRSASEWMNSGSELDWQKWQEMHGLPERYTEADWGTDSASGPMGSVSGMTWTPRRNAIGQERWEKRQADLRDRALEDQKDQKTREFELEKLRLGGTLEKEKSAAVVQNQVALAEAQAKAAAATPQGKLADVQSQVAGEDLRMRAEDRKERTQRVKTARARLAEMGYDAGDLSDDDILSRYSKIMESATRMSNLGDKATDADARDALASGSMSPGEYDAFVNRRFERAGKLPQGFGGNWNAEMGRDNDWNPFTSTREDKLVDAGAGAVESIMEANPGISYSTALEAFARRLNEEERRDERVQAALRLLRDRAATDPRR
jgi:hypothetical protein